MPSHSEEQRKFMGAELARKREGKKTKTDMSESQLEDFASKPIAKAINDFIAKAEYKAGRIPPVDEPKLPEGTVVGDKVYRHGKLYPIKGRSKSGKIITDYNQKSLSDRIDSFIEKSKTTHKYSMPQNSKMPKVPDDAVTELNPRSSGKYSKAEAAVRAQRRAQDEARIKNAPKVIKKAKNIHSRTLKDKLYTSHNKSTGEIVEKPDKNIKGIKKYRYDASKYNPGWDKPRRIKESQCVFEDEKVEKGGGSKKEYKKGLDIPTSRINKPVSQMTPEEKEAFNRETKHAVGHNINARKVRAEKLKRSPELAKWFEEIGKERQKEILDEKERNGNLPSRQKSSKIEKILPAIGPALATAAKVAPTALNTLSKVKMLDSANKIGKSLDNGRVSKFEKKTPTFKCDSCGKNTRKTAKDNSRLCPGCHKEALEENRRSDYA